MVLGNFGDAGSVRAFLHDGEQPALNRYGRSHIDLVVQNDLVAAKAGVDIGKLPVMDITQQRYFRPEYYISYKDPVTNEVFYEIYPRTENIGDIYVATFGRGVYMTDLDYVGIDDQPDDATGLSVEALHVYPNPSMGDLNINITVEGASNSFVEVYDLSGRSVYSHDCSNLGRGKQEIVIPAGSLTRGTYVVQYNNGNTLFSQKVIILK